jgi:hypothetical protein
METHRKKTIYQFTTSSERVARAIEQVLNDHKCAQLLALFERLKTPKRRNTLLRVAGYMAAGRPLIEKELIQQ